MVNRRSVLKQTCTLALGLAASRVSAGLGVAAPFPMRALPAGIRSVIRRDETLMRLGGVGDGYKMTWGADDNLYVAVNDGTGWIDQPRMFYGAMLWTIDGDIRTPSFTQVETYPEVSDATRPEDAPKYYGHGMLAVKGRIYQFLSTLDQAKERPRHWQGSKLIYSDDNGRTWYNQDGTTPVTWADWDTQSQKTLTFFQEPNGSFALLSILQMGQEYSENRDGYIYVYGLNGNVDGLMNELVMFRVPVDDMLNRDAYEYFAGHKDDGSASWASDINARAVVHTFPRGWVNGTNLYEGDLVLDSWVPSVVYNKPLDLYMMASAGIGCAPDGTAFGKPSYLGFWVSSTPWGPWRQIHEETEWTPAGDQEARCYAPQIAPKWISEDGTSCWLLWADLKGLRKFGQDMSLLDAALEKAKSPEQSSAVTLDFFRRYIPGFSCNAQRIDLTLG